MLRTQSPHPLLEEATNSPLFAETPVTTCWSENAQEYALDLTQAPGSYAEEGLAGLQPMFKTFREEMFSRLQKPHNSLLTVKTALHPSPDRTGTCV